MSGRDERGAFAPEAELVDELLFDRFGTPATYTPAGGVGAAILVDQILDDDVIRYSDRPGAVVGQVAMLVRAAEIAQPKAGDRIEVADGTYLVRSFVREDAIGLLWRLQVQRAPEGQP